MSTNHQNPFENFLREHDEAWTETVGALLPSIHEVDKNATQIWFAFFPLELLRALEQSEDADALAKRLLLQGHYYLRDQIDTSHQFLYGHRYWPQVKQAIAERAQTNKTEGKLEAQILETAREVAASLKVEASLLVGITAVAFMTVRQAGLEAFNAAPGAISMDNKGMRKSPGQILQERAKDDSQGLFGFLKSVDQQWTVTYDENQAGAKFKLINSEELASAAARDQSRDWRSMDPRCVEGPIPVECRSASCGTCWVGVLGGAEKLSAVSVREGKKIKEFGYINTTEPQPVIRLACMAQATGAVSIVIPAWNGVFGTYLREQEEQAQEALS